MSEEENTARVREWEIWIRDKPLLSYLTAEASAETAFEAGWNAAKAQMQRTIITRVRDAVEEITKMMERT